jgi:hypothetical protein
MVRFVYRYFLIEQNGLSNQCGIYVLGDGGGTIFFHYFLWTFTFNTNKIKNIFILYNLIKLKVLDFVSIFFLKKKTKQIFLKDRSSYVGNRIGNFFYNGCANIIVIWW